MIVAIGQALGIALGVEYLHSRSPPIIHGDIKATNVLVDDGGNPRISDFGLAIPVENRTIGLTTTGSFQATLRWLSPELANGMIYSEHTVNMKRTESSDVWAFGCLLIEVCFLKS